MDCSVENLIEIIKSKKYNEFEDKISKLYDYDKEFFMIGLIETKMLKDNEKHFLIENHLNNVNIKKFLTTLFLTDVSNSLIKKIFNHVDFCDEVMINLVKKKDEDAKELIEYLYLNKKIDKNFFINNKNDATISLCVLTNRIKTINFIYTNFKLNINIENFLNLSVLSKDISFLKLICEGNKKIKPFILKNVLLQTIYKNNNNAFNYLVDKINIKNNEQDKYILCSIGSRNNYTFDYFYNRNKIKYKTNLEKCFKSSIENKNLYIAEKLIKDCSFDFLSSINLKKMESDFKHLIEDRLVYLKLKDELNSELISKTIKNKRKF